MAQADLELNMQLRKRRTLRARIKGLNYHSQFYAGLGLESRALFMLGKHCTPNELHPQLQSQPLNHKLLESQPKCKQVNGLVLKLRRTVKPLTPHDKTDPDVDEQAT